MKVVSLMLEALCLSRQFVLTSPEKCRFCGKLQPRVATKTREAMATYK